VREQIPQAIDQIFEGESGCAGAGGEFIGHLHELAFALGGFLFQLFVRDEGSCALMGFEQAAEFEFAIRAHDGVGIDGEVDGELADGGELIAFVERSGGYGRADLVDELAVDGDAGVQVEGELEGGGGELSHACQCTTVLVQYVKCFLIQVRGPRGLKPQIDLIVNAALTGRSSTVAITFAPLSPTLKAAIRLLKFQKEGTVFVAPNNLQTEL
jgi:hypothetical protein